ncbi:MAG: DUF2723 domain-containing protein [Deltaproteobacteria bacterium]|nr:DUF2723 domain-containing protein [Deltaproteobacteria bacterium]
MYRASRWAGLVLAAGVPLAVVLALIGDTPYWLDSPEFVGAAFTLNPAHPPGHPLYILLGRAILLVPIGSAAFKLNLLGGLCASGALAAAYAASMSLVERGFGVRHPLAVLTPAAGCVLIGLSPAWLHQALYAEVYALQALLLSVVILCALRALLPGGTGRERWLLGAVLALGFTLTNHHLTGFLLVPGLIAAVTASALERRLVQPSRLLVIAMVLVGAALLTYALIPVRGAAAPSLLLGRVENLSDFVWLISAKVYQKSLTGGLAHPGDVAGVLFIVAEQVGPWLCILALGGLYFTVRVKGSRASGVLLVAAAGVVLAGRMMLRFDRTNPDVTGYLLLVLVLVVVSLSALSAALHNLSRRLATLKASALLAVAVLVGWQVSLGWERIRRGVLVGDGVERAQVEVREFGVARLPPGAVAVSTLYATSFLTWYGRVVEGERPDVRHVPLPFVGYRGEAAVLVEEWSELAPLVRGFLVSGSLPASEMASLSQDRAVFVEPDPFLDKGHIQYLEPQGLFMAFRPEPVARRDVYAAADATADRIDGLLATRGVLEEPQTRRYVLWWLYNRTLVLARRGYTSGAIRCAGQALDLVPGVPELIALRKYLTDEPGPLKDPMPFLPR